MKTNTKTQNREFVMLTKGVSGISLMLLISLVVFIIPATAQQNIFLTPTVQPTQGNHTQVGNFALDYTVGEPMQTTLQNGNLMLTQGFEQMEKPLPPIAPASQTVCSDTAVTFVFSGKITSAGADQLEWSYDSTFSYSTIVNSDSIVRITVAIGSTDTIYMRSRVSGNKLVSKNIVYTILKVNFKPDAPTPPAPVSVNSDTAFTFHFLNLNPGYGGNELEWTLDSSFTTSWLMTCYDTTINGKDTSDCNIMLTVSSESDTMFWLRSIDSVTGCISDAKASIAIVTNIFQRQPITVDSVLNICSGTATTIKIPTTSHTNRYDLLTDTGTVASVFGNDTTLNINTGNVFTNTFFTILRTDTATNDTTEFGYILISVLGDIDTNVVIEGDTLAYVNDSALYEGIAMYGIKGIYSIISGSATVDSLTGWVYNISSDSFTVRATMYAPTGCGSAYADLKVNVTDVAPPVAPAPKTLLVDTDLVVTVSFDSIVVGTVDDEIEWSVYKNFGEYQTINPFGIISINLVPGMDTVIWLRSNKWQSIL